MDEQLDSEMVVKKEEQGVCKTATDENGHTTGGDSSKHQSTTEARHSKDSDRSSE